MYPGFTAGKILDAAPKLGSCFKMRKMFCHNMAVIPSRFIESPWGLNINSRMALFLFE
jgi:hypothetical protein